jgi:hypothetical protein
VRLVYAPGCYAVLIFWPAAHHKNGFIEDDIGLSLVLIVNRS